MAAWQVDRTPWPIVIHTFEGNLTDAQLDDYVNEATTVFLEGGPHVTILNAIQMGSVSAYGRARCVAWFKAHRAQLAKSCLGLAYVIRSPLIRYMTMTVLLVVSLPMPYAVCETQEEALAWARKRVARPEA